ncbi:Transmembrane protein 208 [Camellia lanceoleosa]|uniref:Transmembrane protein 208 n=1 Tax=Camellia lanceoleosa TaxID=1840588 RepID=A0ACC0I158_9ERIC|nr:Transmembrane protein 208 [Camellia lanceoleosa]
MANQGAKKRKEENGRRLKNLLRFIIFANVFYLVVRAGIFHSTFKWKHWVGFMLTFFAYIIPYQQLAMMAKPTYSESGELEDGGFDLTTDGVCGYLHDVIYITGFVQLTTIISEKFWYIYLVAFELLINKRGQLVVAWRLYIYQRLQYTNSLVL